MSFVYQPVRYDGALGDVGACSLRQHDAPREIQRPNVTVQYLATGESTDGQYGLYRWEMGPAPAGPDPHFHRTLTEAFYVLTGSVRLFDGRHWTEGVPGDFLHVPFGGVHAFRNESGQPASMLILFTPGAPREDYFERVGTVARMSPQEREAFFLTHDTFWV